MKRYRRSPVLRFQNSRLICTGHGRKCAAAFSHIWEPQLRVRGELVMKCSECQTLIEDYVDGALGEKAGALVSTHVAACSECASFREALIREQAIYARYERDVEVTPMLWTSIEARIKQERAAEPVGWLSRLRERMVGMFAAPRLSPALAFAIVLVAIAVTVIVMTRLNPGVREVANNNANVSVPEAGGDNSNR